MKRPTTPEALSRRLQIWRMENDITQKEAAAIMRISRRTYENWEQQKAMPNGLGIVALEKIVNTWKRKKTE